MATNLALDDDLIERAKTLGKHATKKAAVTAALEAYIRLREQQRVVALFDSVDFDPSFDPRGMRRKRPRT